jgi:hypothetical protein
MTRNFGRKALLGTATAAALGGSMIASAQAAMRFTNVADRPIIFTIRCADDSETDRWTVGEGRTLSLACNNGASEALVRLFTSDGAVVSRAVVDGSSYDLGFDGDGDATIE